MEMDPEVMRWIREKCLREVHKIRRPNIRKKGARRGKGGPENGVCEYRGVRKRIWGKWVAEIREPKKRIWIESFDTAKEAAMAYVESARRLYGADAHLNFPEECNLQQENAFQTCGNNNGGVEDHKSGLGNQLLPISNNTAAATTPEIVESSSPCSASEIYWSSWE